MVATGEHQFSQIILSNSSN